MINQLTYWNGDWKCMHATKGVMGNLFWSGVFGFLGLSWVKVQKSHIWDCGRWKSGPCLLGVQLLTHGCTNLPAPSVSHYWWSLDPILILAPSSDLMAWSCLGMALTKNRPKPREYVGLVIDYNRNNGLMLNGPTGSKITKCVSSHSLYQLWLVSGNCGENACEKPESFLMSNIT